MEVDESGRTNAEMTEECCDDEEKERRGRGEKKKGKKKERKEWKGKTDSERAGTNTQGGRGSL